jgi:hypothetical protein
MLKEQLAAAVDAAVAYRAAKPREKSALKAALLDAIRLYGKRPLNELEAHLRCEPDLIPGAFVTDWENCATSQQNSATY